MKPIDQMNLAELADAIEYEIYGHPLASLSPHMKRLRELHELTRWIPVSERMPTEEDGDEHGEVLVSETENESPYRRYQQMTKWDSVDDVDYFYTVTHWQRITPPEGV